MCNGGMLFCILVFIVYLCGCFDVVLYYVRFIDNEGLINGYWLNINY